jgi:hypothetical protein
MVVSFGPQSVYTKGEGYYSYLQELEPGTYVYYGSLATHPRGWLVGTCMCMGTVTFEVEAGRITNLGDFPTMRWVTEEQARAVRRPTRGAGAAGFGRLRAARAACCHAPCRARVACVRQDQQPSRVVVGRMPPMPGVLAYDRDSIIDLKARDETAAGGGS